MSSTPNGLGTVTAASSRKFGGPWRHSPRYPDGEGRKPLVYSPARETVPRPRPARPAGVRHQPVPAHRPRDDAADERPPARRPDQDRLRLAGAGGPGRPARHDRRAAGLRPQPLEPRQPPGAVLGVADAPAAGRPRHHARPALVVPPLPAPEGDDHPRQP